jgi:hypothetical protein
VKWFILERSRGRKGLRANKGSRFAESAEQVCMLHRGIHDIGQVPVNELHEALDLCSSAVRLSVRKIGRKIMVTL